MSMPQERFSKFFTFYLYAQQVLIKGWEISILLILPLLQVTNRISLAELGVLSVTFSIAQTLSSLVSGTLLHRSGSRKVMLFSIFAFLCAWLLFLFQPPFIIMLLIFTLGGASSGLSETSGITLITKNLFPGRRANGIANLGMAGDLGRIVFTGLTSFLIGINNFTILLLGNLILAIGLLFWFFIARKHFPAHQPLAADNRLPQKPPSSIT